MAYRTFRQRSLVLQKFVRPLPSRTPNRRRSTSYIAVALPKFRFGRGARCEETLASDINKRVISLAKAINHGRDAKVLRRLWVAGISRRRLCTNDAVGLSSPPLARHFDRRHR
ncbi:MAG TPA: hypothetical protein DDX19_19580 [Rhodopirellula baltica]|nr:hypothetical protein [Rhodopirellula baltica]